eukprot:m.448770 g.448770  ORF g.448770 m.448770 type:complete len:72 (-) comp19707_c0_seq1:97-312(-)
MSKALLEILKKGGPLSHRPVIVHVALDTNKGDLLRAPVVYLLYHDTDCVPPLFVPRFFFDGLLSHLDSPTQ